MPLTPCEKRLLDEDQAGLASRCNGEGRVLREGIIRVGGCSQQSPGAGSEVASAVVCLRVPGLIPVSGSFSMTTTDLTYEPTYLTYREGPALIKALDLLPDPPDVLLVPATGRDHPRCMGMARHIGCIMSLPTIGVTRRPLSGESPAEYSPGGGRAPIYVSPGWGIGATESLRIVVESMGEHRMPEPIYLARNMCRELCPSPRPTEPDR